MGYLVIKGNNQTRSYTLDSTSSGKPYLKVSNSYLNLTTDDTTGLRLNVKTGSQTYRPYQTSTYTDSNSGHQTTRESHYQNYEATATSYRGAYVGGVDYWGSYNKVSNGTTSVLQTYKNNSATTATNWDLVKLGAAINLDNTLTAAIYNCNGASVTNEGINAYVLPTGYTEYPTYYNYTTRERTTSTYQGTYGSTAVFNNTKSTLDCNNGVTTAKYSATITATCTKSYRIQAPAYVSMTLQTIYSGYVDRTRESYYTDYYYTLTRTYV